jgi:hypothetical protein
MENSMDYISTLNFGNPLFWATARREDFGVVA